MHDLSRGAIDLRREVDAFERTYIDRALDLTGGNLSQAAQLLGCTRFTLKRRLGQEEE
jgi:two-component system response regulator AtoC